MAGEGRTRLHWGKGPRDRPLTIRPGATKLARCAQPDAAGDTSGTESGILYEGCFTRKHLSVSAVLEPGCSTQQAKIHLGLAPLGCSWFPINSNILVSEMF